MNPGCYFVRFAQDDGFEEISIDAQHLSYRAYEHSNPEGYAKRAIQEPHSLFWALLAVGTCGAAILVIGSMGTVAVLHMIGIL